MPLDPEAQVILETMSATSAVDPFDLTPAQWREALAGAPGGTDAPELERIEMQELPGPDGPIPVRVYTPAGKGKKPGVVFFHGGGWVLCDLDTHDATCRELAAGADCVVVSVDYRIAPEAKFPAAPEDCYAATLWTAREAERLGIDPSRIAVAGDSAGGNLAAVVSMLCRDRGGPDLAHQLLIYPVTNQDFETESYRQNGQDYFLTRDMMRWFWHQYLESEAEGANPLASPLRAEDLEGLPPATIFTADYDPLRDEGRAYAERLQKAGIPTQYTNYPGVFHGFFAMPQELPRARQAVDDACTALKAAFQG
jgi:acetyl esterase